MVSHLQIEGGLSLFKISQKYFGLLELRFRICFAILYLLNDVLISLFYSLLACLNCSSDWLLLSAQYLFSNRIYLCRFVSHSVLYHGLYVSSRFLVDCLL